MQFADSAETFVKLKYEIITSDRNTWHLCETYPAEVRSKWAWRCAADVEHLAKGHKEAEHCIEVAKRYRDGLATKEELEATARNDFAHIDVEARNASRAAYYAAKSAYATTVAALAAYYAAKAAKWNLYISWLIEELYEWGNKQLILQ